MRSTNIPAKFQIPWANNAGSSYIRTPPVPSQVPIQAGAASFTDGFPPLSMTPIISGGVPPFGQDANGILRAITQWNQWQQAGGVVPYDSVFQFQISGYPLGAVVGSATAPGVLWQSTVDGNMTNPDAGGAGWSTAYILSFDTFAAAQAANVPSAATFINLRGYYTLGDYGASLYQKVTGASFQLTTADGATWAVVIGALCLPQMFGAQGNGVADDTGAIQNAINSLPRGGTGEVFFPPGHYIVLGGISITGAVILRGAGQNATFIDVNHSDVVALQISGHRNSVIDMTIYGKGMNVDTTTLGAVHAAVTISGVAHVLRDCTIWGGNNTIYMSSTDTLLIHVAVSYGYGPQLVGAIGPNWIIQCSFDQSATSVAVTSSQPYAAWQAGHNYTVGQAVIVGGYAIAAVAVTTGISGGSAPTVANYGINIPDSGVTWQLLAPQSFAGLLLGTSPGENHVFMTDLSGGAGFTNSVVFSANASANGPNVLVLDNCVCSSPISITGGDWVDIVNNEIGTLIQVTPSFAGRVRISGNCSLGIPSSISIGSGVSNFIISENDLGGGGSIIIAAGSSNHYNIVNNIGATVTDSAMGANHTTSGNN